MGLDPSPPPLLDMRMLRSASEGERQLDASEGERQLDASEGERQLDASEGERQLDTTMSEALALTLRCLKHWHCIIGFT